MAEITPEKAAKIAAVISGAARIPPNRRPRLATPPPLRVRAKRKGTAARQRLTAGQDHDNERTCGTSRRGGFALPRRPMVGRGRCWFWQAASRGCANDVRDFKRQPALSAVGSGLLADRVPAAGRAFAAPSYRPGNSIWQDSSADLFKDPRARKIGDVVTVKISIKDKATIDNNSKRSRDSKASLKPYSAMTSTTTGGLEPYW